MSVIVRKDGELINFAKGADCAILEKSVGYSDVYSQLDRPECMALRTLVFAMGRDIEESNYETIGFTGVEDML